MNRGAEPGDGSAGHCSAWLEDFHFLWPSNARRFAVHGKRRPPRLDGHWDHEPATVSGRADILVRSLGRSREYKHSCRHWVIVGARADRNVRAPAPVHGEWGGGIRETIPGKVNCGPIFHPGNSIQSLMLSWNAGSGHAASGRPIYLFSWDFRFGFWRRCVAGRPHRCNRKNRLPAGWVIVMQHTPLLVVTG